MGKADIEYTWNLVAKKLSGESTPEELKELERLLRENPDLHYPLQAVTDLWKPAGKGNQPEAERAFERHLDRMKDLSQPSDEISGTTPDILSLKIKRTVNRKLSVTAALCLLAIASAWILLRSVNNRPGIAQTTKQSPANQSAIYSPNGSRTNLLLPDGTQVWLNAGSRIIYDKNFGNTSREVTLTGEAFFDVAKNAEKPFVIHASRIDIKVLGTRFNVKSYPSDRTTETTLIKGSIEVSIKDRPNERIILKPNEKLVVANDDSTLQRAAHRHQNDSEELLVSIKKPTIENNTGAIIETLWVENKLSFQEENFRELAAQMERWYAVSIRFAKPELEDLQFTGSFKQESIRQALDALKLTSASSFTYEIQENTITILPNEKNKTK